LQFPCHKIDFAFPLLRNSRNFYFYQQASTVEDDIL